MTNKKIKNTIHLPRRVDRIISEKESIRILDAAIYGVLATISPDGSSYGIPLNFVRKDQKIFLHCALEGKKLENIEHDNRVCFCVVGKAEIISDQFTMEYESVVVTGTAKIISSPEKKRAALKLLCEKYQIENVLSKPFDKSTSSEVKNDISNKEEIIHQINEYEAIKYSKLRKDKINSMILSHINRVAVLQIDIQSITGKANIMNG
ncbi:MAG: pyridoxamine 5'-phosphate oxidase family protein [Thermoguttaceae bacterium]